MATETTVYLAEFETKALLARETRAAGTYRTKLMVRCSSLLSSVYVKACDVGATIKVNYFDTTTGSEFTSERYDLNSHDLLDSSNIGETVRILVPKIHNKPQVEVIVTGGSAEFGVYATAVPTTASDLDSALIRDGDTFDSLVSKALPFACLNETTGELEFVRCADLGGGSTVTTPDIGNLPMPLANTQYSYTFPANTKRYIIQNVENHVIEVGITTGFTTLKWTMFPGDRLTEKSIELTGLTLYFKSPKAAQELEIWSWS